MNEIRVSAKNVSDAITEASIQLGVTSSELEYEVIEKGSAGFLGIGSKQAVIRAWKKVKEESVEEIRTEVQHEKKTSSEQQTEKIKSITEPHKDVKKTEPVKKEHVKEVIKREEKLSEVQENTKEACEKFLHDVLKTMGMEVEIISSIDQDGALCIEMQGEHMGILIGKRGQTLDSLQYLTNRVANKMQDGYVRVKLDTENYRQRRKETLENLAKNIAYKVKRTKKPVSLEPMNPYERRIIHAAVQNDKYVTTRSEGEEPFRHVVIALKKEAVTTERKGRYDRAGRGRSDRSYGYKGNNRRGGSYQSAPKAEPVTETVSESAQE